MSTVRSPAALLRDVDDTLAETETETGGDGPRIAFNALSMPRGSR